MKCLVSGLAFVALMASAAAFANEVVPTPHDVIRCVVNGDVRETLIFAYDQHGKTGEQDRPGFCRLNAGHYGNPYDSYWCWVAETKTAITADGQLAIQFVKHLGGYADVYTQLNIPARPQTVFSGTMRIISRSAKDLRVPIKPRDGMRIDCRAETLLFNDYSVTK